MTKEELGIFINKNVCQLDEHHLSLLENLMADTLDANKRFNLTAIKEEEKFRELMIYDSLLPLKYFDFSNSSILDIGTGAGFPGLPLAICSKGNFTLLDSTKKKIDHINTLIKKYGIKNTEGYSARAEGFIQNKRDMFDFVVARAVAPLNILLELAVPFLKINGTFIALKGSGYEEEIASSKNAINKLGVEIIDIYKDELPISLEKRAIIAFKKVNKTNNKYPRDYSDIKKKPL